MIPRPSTLHYFPTKEQRAQKARAKAAVLCSDDAILQIEQDAAEELAAAHLGIPSLRGSGGTLSKMFDTGEWVRGRHEQMAVYYAVSDASLPLLCLGRAQRFRTGTRGSKEKRKRPEQYQIIDQAWAYNLADHTHVSALLTALSTLKVFHYHNERLVREGLLQVPQIESHDVASLDKVELSRVELSTSCIATSAGQVPDRVEQVIYAGRSWNPLRGKACWQIYLALDGWIDDRLQEVRFHDGPARVHLRHESIPKLIEAVRACLNAAQIKFNNLGKSRRRCLAAGLIWDDAEYQRCLQPELHVLDQPGCVYQPTLFTASLVQQPAVAAHCAHAEDSACHFERPCRHRRVGSKPVWAETELKAQRVGSSNASARAPPSLPLSA